VSSAASSAPDSASIPAPAPDLVLTPLRGQPRPLAQYLSIFHLVVVAVDPFTDESARLLPTAGRLLANFEQADCTVAWLVAGDQAECHSFLGPWATRFVTFSDPDRLAIKRLSLQWLPALVHIGPEAEVVGCAEGWNPREWQHVVDRLARVLSWRGPQLPAASDPSPFGGTPALG